MMSIVAARQGQAAETVDAKWAIIRADAAAIPGQPYEIAVELKEVPAGQQLAVDLNYLKSNGKFGGLLGYAPRRDATAGKTEKFTFKIEPKDDVLKVFATVFLSPDGSWDKRTATARGPAVPFGQEAAEKAAEAARNARPDTATLRKSWIAVDAPSGPITEGEPFEIKVDYYLDPSETWGEGTKLSLVAHGPWIDNPDGKYSKHRQHITYRGAAGLGKQIIDAQVGRHRHVFKYTAPKAFKYNGLLLIAGFQDAAGKGWPWNVRTAGPQFEAKRKHYTLETDRPGNLFTYDQTPTLRIVFHDGAVAGQSKTLRYTLWDTAGRAIEGEHAFTVGAPGTHVAFVPPVLTRGTFALIAEVDGWGEREAVFATIPDLKSIAGAPINRFAVTNVRTERTLAAAKRLGFTMVRQFMSWKLLQPGPDHWTLEPWDRVLALSNAHGLQPWVCLYDPPAWSQEGMPRNVGFSPYPFDEAAVRQTVTTLGQRWRGQIWGWEWLNEIVPGNLVDDPVQTYVRFVQAATTAARQADPAVKIQLAGGLWPRNYRVDLLKNGIASYIDVLPVHYSNFDGVRDAQDDLAAVGAADVAVWDNESSSGHSVWGMPTTEMIQIHSQSQWILQRWPDELTGGARQITLFGGQADPAGNWSYLLDEQTPRPMAATLAVLISKLSHARALGKFYLDGGAVIQAFEREGAGVLVAFSSSDQPVRVTLDLGANEVRITDYQGNETQATATDGRLSIELSAMPVFIEGASADLFKARLALTVGASSRPVALGQISAVRGSDAVIPLRVTNHFDQPIEANVSLHQPDGAAVAAQPVQLAPGQVRIVELTVPAAAADSAGGGAWAARIALGRSGVQAVDVPFRIDWIDAAMLGNLLENGDFETAGVADTAAAGWTMASGASRVAADGQLGAGDWAVRFKGTGGWVRASQGVALPPGRTYLYTAWVQTGGVKQAGSNITYINQDGSRKELYIPHVFQAPSKTNGWHLLSYRGTAPETLKEAHFTPLAQGTGDTLVDNVRVTMFEGSNFATEATQATAPPTIDGRLSEWTDAIPIPLLCGNQLSGASGTYQWSPENLRGVAYMKWDAQALYLAVDVIDDQHTAAATGEQTLSDDALMLALQPSRLGAQSNDKAFAYYISAAAPGGGSGRHTLYRPRSRAGGQSSGQLAKDSSVYDIAVQREGNHTRYEVRLPWSELGGISPQPGTRLGLSLQLHDRDAVGQSASMLWGEGLVPAWEPSTFGVLTLVK